MSAARQFRAGRGVLTPEEAALRCKECTEVQVDWLMVELRQKRLLQHQRAVNSADKAHTGAYAAVALLFFVLIAGSTFLCFQVELTAVNLHH